MVRDLSSKREHPINIRERIFCARQRSQYQYLLACLVLIGSERAACIVGVGATRRHRIDGLSWSERA